MSYRDAANYIGSKTKVLELCNRFGARVMVCPEWNGRVMSSSCDGPDGDSFGLVNVKMIESENIDPAFAFYGGEDQFTLSPEGGPFSLYYSTESELPDNDFHSASRDFFTVPVGFREGPFTVDTAPPDPQIRMRRSFRMTNLAGARLDLDAVRTVRLLTLEDVRSIFGDLPAVVLEQTDVSFVGFETVNSIVNSGQPHSKSTGLVSIRIRSMLNSGLNSVAIVPFRSGGESERGPSICADFFGTAPHGRLRVLPQAALLRADSKYRCQIGVSRKRVLPFLGSVDFRNGYLTLISFNLPVEPWEHDYLSNEYCETVSNTVVDFVNTREYYLTENILKAQDGESFLERDPEETPYTGEVVRAYNHGPSRPGEELSGPFYEFDVFSPARELRRGDSLTHRQYTLHINADNQTLSHLVQNVLGVDYDRVFEKMMR